MPASQHEEDVRPLIIQADDDPTMLKTVELMMRGSDFRLLQFASAQDALYALHELPTLPALVLTDYEMPGMNGLTLAANVKNTYPTLPVLMMSDNTLEPDLSVQAARTGAAFLPKNEVKITKRTEFLNYIEQAIAGGKLPPSFVATHDTRKSQIAGRSPGSRS